MHTADIQNSQQRHYWIDNFYHNFKHTFRTSFCKRFISSNIPFVFILKLAKHFVSKVLNRPPAILNLKKKHKIDILNLVEVELFLSVIAESCRILYAVVWLLCCARFMDNVIIYEMEKVRLLKNKYFAQCDFFHQQDIYDNKLHNRVQKYNKYVKTLSCILKCYEVVMEITMCFTCRKIP